MLHKVYIYYLVKYIVLLGQVYCITLPSILYYFCQVLFLFGHNIFISTLTPSVLPILQGLLHTLLAAHLLPDMLQRPWAFLCLAEHTQPSVAFVLDKE